MTGTTKDLPGLEKQCENVVRLCRAVPPHQDLRSSRARPRPASAAAGAGRAAADSDGISKATDFFYTLPVKSKICSTKMFANLCWNFTRMYALEVPFLLLARPLCFQAI